MSDARRRTLVHIALATAAGALLGGLYQHAIAGAVAGLLLSFGWHLSQLFIVERALRKRRYDAVPDGSGIWSQILARLNYERTRGSRHKRRYRRLLKDIRSSTNAMPDGGIIINVSGEIVRYNKQAQVLAGLQARRDRGQRIDNLLRHPAFIAMLHDGKPAEPAVIPSPVTENGWCSCSIVPFGPNQRLVLIQDISKQTRQAKVRRDFVANASHELRSPLTVLSGYLEAFVDDPELPAAWHKPVEEMRSQAARMQAVLTDLLELSRLESTDSAPVDQMVNVNELCVSVQESLQRQSATPIIEFESKTSVQLYGAAAEIESVISNLLRNAIRHTPADGHIRIRWEMTADGPALTVSDTGEGIPADDLPRITERFFRVHRGRSRDDGGAGLGLAIVKHALDRHGTTLTVESDAAVGSTFVCQFPKFRAAAIAELQSDPVEASVGQ